jgi:hypothetical protein
MDAVKKTPSIKAILLEDVVGKDIEKARNFLKTFE